MVAVVVNEFEVVPAEPPAERSATVPPAGAAGAAPALPELERRVAACLRLRRQRAARLEAC